jgi:hypothetical protein
MHCDSRGWMKLLAAGALALCLSLGMFGCRGWNDEEPPPWLDASTPSAGTSGDDALQAGASGAAAGASGATAGEARSGGAGSGAGTAAATTFRATPDR